MKTSIQLDFLIDRLLLFLSLKQQKKLYYQLIKYRMSADEEVLNCIDSFFGSIERQRGSRRDGVSQK
jgi:hypothetical protein